MKKAFAKTNGEDDIYKTLNPQTALLYYAGNVTASKELFVKYPINTDDKPVIEYMAPRHYRNEGKDKTPWFVGPYLAKFIKGLQNNCPPDSDPLLVHRSATNRRLPSAGSAYHETLLWSQFGNRDESGKNWEKFLKEWLDQ